MGRVLEIRSSPHVGSGHSVETIMLHVVLALVPVSAWAVYAFGLAALATLATAVGSCVLFEHLLTRRRGRSAIGDWSAVITGLLLGLTLPPGLPVWMTVVGSAIAMGIGKHLFGGLGYNVLNPALVGRAVLQAAFPVPMTTWFDGFSPARFSALPASTLTPPLLAPTDAAVSTGAVDAVSGATPLAAWKFDGAVADTADLWGGFTSGSTGETAAGLIVLGGLYLVARNFMNWRIPASILVTVAAASALLHAVDASYPSAVFMLGAGGLMLGAVFMASDMVGSPMTNLGCAVYGVLIGALIVVIRLWGGMPEGVMYAILLGNAATPHIDALIQPRVYGTGRRAARGGAS